MAERASELSDDLDSGWDELDSVPPQSAASALGEPELEAVDEGWDEEEDGPEPLRSPVSGVRQSPRGSLSKKERRELERRLRSRAAQTKSQRKAEQKERRREEARRLEEERRLEAAARAAEQRKVERREAKRARPTSKAASAKRETPRASVAPRAERLTPALAPSQRRARARWIVAALIVVLVVTALWFSRS